MYKVNNLVLVKNQKSTKFGQNAYNCLCTLTEVGNNETLKINKGAVSDKYNLSNIIHYT